MPKSDARKRKGENLREPFGAPLVGKRTEWQEAGRVEASSETAGKEERK